MHCWRGHISRLLVVVMAPKALVDPVILFETCFPLALDTTKSIQPLTPSHEACITTTTTLLMLLLPSWRTAHQHRGQPSGVDLICVISQRLHIQSRTTRRLNNDSTSPTSNQLEGARITRPQRAPPLVQRVGKRESMASYIKLSYGLFAPRLRLAFLPPPPSSCSTA
jgi:hypothetical protein